MTAADAERSAFLRAVIANPGDDLPRLIFADWLDGHGEPERAEFIRVQCELTTREYVRYAGEGAATWHARSHALRRRERELLKASGGAWTPALKYPYRAPEDSGSLVFGFSRGFVEWLECSWGDWRQHARPLLTQAPIREVKLTTLPPEPLPERLWRRRGRPVGNFVYRIPGLRWRRLKLTADERRSPVATYPIWHKLCAAYWPGVTFMLPAAERRPVPVAALRAPCARCAGVGSVGAGAAVQPCPDCGGAGWLSVGEVLSRRPDVPPFRIVSRRPAVDPDPGRRV